MTIKRLTVVEFEVNKDNPPSLAEEGFKYSYFQDPQTGKFYRPKQSFEVTGDDLEQLFEELIYKKS